MIFVSSCKKDNYIEPSATTVETMDELVVPSDFNWKTTRDYQFNVTTASNGIATITSENGNVIYLKAFITANEAYTMKIALPSYEKKVQISFKGQTEILELTGTTLNHQFNF